jgi:hypothetical protein
MTVGDSINISGNSWQPASGVEVMVLKMMLNSGPYTFGFTDGTTNTLMYHSGNAYNEEGNKYPITNTHYFTIQGTHSALGFAGIQIK